ncbi:hypothetical protein V6N12_073755 [Hibiscus sabdariffa]|uniref:Reverse transcriptase Ty1/copia-type domain-containing protein n=1 Tax=Hibiscus sabdariffa TaxID=183260 RepID=A0ABR2CTD4_9ROSI
MWTGKSPNMSFMRIWGCKAYVKHQMFTKLETKSKKCTFVGYPKETKGYYFYNENKEVQQQQVIEPEVEGISQAVKENPTDLETQPLRRSTRERHEPERYGFLVTTHGDVILVDQDEPKTYQEAVASPDSKKWLEAMRSEMDSMSENQVWTLVEPPEGIKPIGCKWVFKKKTDMDGNVQTYKGRLVAKGFRQIHGVDYDETFSPVAMFKSIRILLAVAAFHDYDIWQMDVKTAFLNGKLEEDVCMTQPEGFVTPENVGKVCKLQRSFYGLKQASRNWNLRFNEAIQEFGFIRNEDEPCVYKKFSGSIVSFLILYVDDILIIGNDIPTLQSIKTWLSSCFSMKHLGEAAYILGVKIYRDRSRRLLGLSQSTYIDKMLKRFSMEESKRGFLPMRHGISLSKEMCPSTPQERERMSQIPYASTIGSIMYAMIGTRPDLSYALSMTSRYQANPGEGHWTAVRNILKYLRRTKDVFLVYGGEVELRIKGYTDASFQTNKDDSRSQSGFVFCLNGGTVSWKSSKQDTVADSTIEAEYVSASEATKEIVWIKKFISELGVVPSISDVVGLYCDNNGAIAEAKEPRSHHGPKHTFKLDFGLTPTIAAFHDYEIWQTDVKTAFLNGKLEADVYMTQPEGFVTPENARKVCKLQRSIYGLKQASRSWNLRFNDAIKEFGFIRNEDEPCVYKKFGGSIVSFLILYVDDILIIGNDVPTLQSIKTWLSSCFSMKDLGEAAYILGVKIYRDRSRRLLGLSQSTYIDKVLKRFSMEESKRGFLPMRHCISLSKEMFPSTPQERERMSQIPYAMICTRPDLSYALSMTSRYQANPGEGHWKAVKNILKYLRRTKDVFLVCGGEEELSIKGYTDASFQTDKDDSRSQSGFVFCLNGGAVSWKSSKQDTVADSTTEAEYIAASEAAKEVVWIKKFISELGVVPSISDVVGLYCDNNVAIAQAKEPRSHQRSKHILRRFHLIREIIDRGDVEICKVHTDDNIADPLTKPLAQQKHDRHTESLGIRYVSDWS